MGSSKDKLLISHIFSLIRPIPKILQILEQPQMLVYFLFATDLDLLIKEFWTPYRESLFGFHGNRSRGTFLVRASCRNSCSYFCGFFKFFKIVVLLKQFFSFVSFQKFVIISLESFSSDFKHEYASISWWFESQSSET